MSADSLSTQNQMPDLNSKQMCTHVCVCMYIYVYMHVSMCVVSPNECEMRVFRHGHVSIVLENRLEATLSDVPVPQTTDTFPSSCNVSCPSSGTRRRQLLMIPNKNKTVEQQFLGFSDDDLRVDSAWQIISKTAKPHTNPYNVYCLKVFPS